MPLEDSVLLEESCLWMEVITVKMVLVGFVCLLFLVWFGFANAEN